MKIRTWMILGIILLLVPLLFGCQKDETFIKKTYISGGNGSSSCNCTNTTNNITNNYTTNISYTSYQCADTISKKLVNVSITNNVLSGVCTDDVTGGANASGGWVNTSKNTTYRLLTIANDSVNNTQIYFTKGNLSFVDDSDWVLNITQNDNVVAKNNISADHFVGDGSLLTNIPSSGLSFSDLLDTQYYFKFQGFESVTAGYTIPWVPTPIATGTANLIAGTPEHPSITDLRTHASLNNSGYSFQISGTTTYSLDTNYTTQVSFKAFTLSNVTFDRRTRCRFGFQDVFTTGAVVDGAYINVTQFNQTHLLIQGEVRSNSVVNYTATKYYIPNNTWVTGSVYMNSSTLATFSLDNGTNVLWSDIVGGVPNGVGRETSHAVLCFNLGNTTIATALANIDYVVVGVNRKLIR